MSQEKFSVKEMEKRVKQLDKAGDRLKAHFVGNDKIIDKILQEIEFWYVMPELLARPPIICLWGMTGVGKTDLVRRLVKELDLENRFLEIQMTNQGRGNTAFDSDSIGEMLSNSSVNEDEQGVLMLDEMQRFRTIEDLKEIHDYKYQDLWTLLSDGQFSRQARDIESQICDMMLDSEISEEHDRVNREINKQEKKNASAADKKMKTVTSKTKSKFHNYRYFANRLKNLLHLDEPVMEIAQWDNKKVIQILMDKSQDKSLYKPQNYSKLLIFISGNLDEVYRNSGCVEEVDIDADVFHESTQDITFVSVKKALKKRFKPEQIARFGNVHIIYPSISRKNYEIIIERTCKSLTDRLKESGGLTVKIDDSVYAFIYRNAVFPLQGTRPVFSTIFSLINNNLTKMAYFTIRKNCKVLSVHYDNESLCLVGRCGKNHVVTLQCEGEIDKIKRMKREEDSDRKYSTIIHEAGHSVVYTDLFGVAPRSITVETASDDFNGFVYPDAAVLTKKNLTKEVAVLLAGRAAEKLVFGEQRVTTGSCGDYQTATTKVGQMVRQWMMYDREAQIVPVRTVNFDHPYYNTDEGETNNQIEEIMKLGAKIAEDVLKKNMHVLSSLSGYLAINKKVDGEEIQQFYKDHLHIEIGRLEPKSVIKAGVEDAYHEFVGGKVVVPETQEIAEEWALKNEIIS